MLRVTIWVAGIDGIGLIGAGSYGFIRGSEPSFTIVGNVLLLVVGLAFLGFALLSQVRAGGDNNGYNKSYLP